MRAIQILFRLRQAAVVVAVVAIASTGYAQEKGAAGPARESDAKLVVRTYEIGDLVVYVPEYFLDGVGGRQSRPSVGGGGFGGGGMGGGGMGGVGGGGGMFSVRDEMGATPGVPGDSERPAALTQITLDALLDAIVRTVAPETWNENGTGEGVIQPIGATLVVRQTSEVHEQIADLLKALRIGSATRRTVAIDARWLLLDSDDLEQLVVAEDDGKSTVNRQVLGEFTRRPTSLRGLTNCFSGQSVYLISGTLRSSVSSYIPVVGSVEPPKPEIMFASHAGDGRVSLVSDEQQSSVFGGRSVGYQPVITTNNFGVQIELRPTLLHGDSAAVVDLKSTITFPGSPSSPEAIDAPANALAPNVDRLAIQTQELATTLRVPLGEPVLVGGMTYMAPALATSGGEAEIDAAAGQGGSAEKPQLYLILEVR